MQNAKLSIIIPVYNAAAYIENCVSSILCQTYPSIEILLINDGSTDISGDICDKLASGNSSIKVIHKENRGSSSARNLGLDLMTGDYFTFCDIDDELCDQKIYEVAIKCFGEPEVDAVFWGARFCENNHEEEFCFEEKEIKVDTHMKKMMQNKTYPLSGYVWNKMWRRTALKTLSGQMIKFDENIFAYEDMIWILYNMENVRKIRTLSRIGYSYKIREDSLSHDIEKRLNITKNGVDAYLLLKEYYQKENQKELVKETNKTIINMLLIKLIVALKAGDKYMLRGLKDMFLAYRKYMKYNPSVKMRIWMVIISLVYKLNKI
ncbi:MAG: glycosyltransferase family 2 protein [Lachnospiraceae bacterium]